MLACVPSGSSLRVHRSKPTTTRPIPAVVRPSRWWPQLPGISRADRAASTRVSRLPRRRWALPRRPRSVGLQRRSSPCRQPEPELVAGPAHRDLCVHRRHPVGGENPVRRVILALSRQEMRLGSPQPRLDLGLAATPERNGSRCGTSVLDPRPGRQVRRRVRPHRPRCRDEGLEDAGASSEGQRVLRAVPGQRAPRLPRSHHPTSGTYPSGYFQGSSQGRRTRRATPARTVDRVAPGFRSRANSPGDWSAHPDRAVIGGDGTRSRGREPRSERTACCGCAK